MPGTNPASENRRTFIQMGARCKMLIFVDHIV